MTDLICFFEKVSLKERKKKGEREGGEWERERERERERLCLHMCMCVLKKIPDREKNQPSLITDTNFNRTQ